jgi:3D-(3,5/4)-trihydroxycyclohexane-1,2-dione acylhydrolase (decyclizing)
VIGAVNDSTSPTDVMVCAAGAMPGDLHKLWRTRDPKGYHVEYGYSCMGYEIAGGIGVKLAAPEREVVVLVGDGSYLMLPGELVTAVQERLKLTVVLVDNHGFNSIGALSRSLGLEGFGTQYRYVDGDRPVLDGDESPPATLPLDLTANAASLGANAERVESIAELRSALARAREADGVSVIVVEVDRYEGVPSYESWWDVPVAEVSELPSVQAARREYETAREAERTFL